MNEEGLEHARTFCLCEQSRKWERALIIPHSFSQRERGREGERVRKREGGRKREREKEGERERGRGRERKGEGERERGREM
jgi:hypothetical protein